MNASTGLVQGAGHGVHAHPGQPQPGVAGPAGLAYQDDVAARDLCGVLGEAAVEPDVDRAAQVPAGELLGERTSSTTAPPAWRRSTSSSASAAGSSTSASWCDSRLSSATRAK